MGWLQLLNYVLRLHFAKTGKSNLDQPDSEALADYLATRHVEFATGSAVVML